MSVMADEGLDRDEPRQYALGAEHAPGVPWQPGSTVGLPEQPAMIAEPPWIAETRAIDKRSTLPPWPARDQGQRGTCVAFALTALREHLAFETGGALPELSEQFLYWATKSKTADPRPASDGTWIRFCRDALAQEGVCRESLWPYNGVMRPGNVAQENPGVDPSNASRADAATKKHAATTYTKGSAAAGSAAELLRELQSCRPLAIALPVFRDALRPAGTNWNSPVGTLYGKVLDPPPTSVVTGGHAVCVTGFQPDPTEPAGGHFIVRNSWGTSWGSRLPTAGYFGPEAGYGQVSASYVEGFLWEMCRL
jgi:Papain family cysteine protease